MDPVIHSAAVAFGFVFIHPFMDGNGPLHRYLIHEELSVIITAANRVSWGVTTGATQCAEGFSMSKGMDQKRSEKKKPQKTLEEKRAAKREKRANKR